MKRLIFAIAALVCGATALQAQQVPALPLDPAVKVGKLDNGMTYYIRHNDTPENRCEFYLATNAGAIQETADQDGLAHFLEHMCFNGTKNFPGKGIINWCESVGASFGANINAGTGIEQTTYMLNNMSLVRPTVVDTCLLILHDYSHFVNCDPEEIDAERGVILEEKRTRNTAGWRTYIKSRSYLYKDTKLGECSLIGSEENLKNFKPESLVNFYQTWYRPDMQALIVVGDINVDEVEAKIKEIFADIPAPVDPKAKDFIDIPDNDEPIIGIITDKETDSSSMDFYWKSDAAPAAVRGSVYGLLNDILNDIVDIIMNERFNAVKAQPNAPFIGGGMGNGDICIGTQATIAEVVFKNGAWKPALDAALTEVEKMVRFGFTDDEVTRAKNELISQYETATKKAETRKNSEFIQGLLGNFFRGEYFMAPEAKEQVAKMLLGQLDATQINQVLKQLNTAKNLVVIYSAPEVEGLVQPTEDEIRKAIADVQASEIAAPVSEAVPEAFLDASKLKGSAVKSSAEGLYGSTVYTLKNGVQVILRPTDIEKDRISFDIYKKGGRSLVSDEDIYSFDSNVWSLYVRNTGIAEFPQTMVNKMLSGKQCSARPYVSSYVHGVQGSSTRKDMETALQMAYLYYTAPRFDENEYNQGIEQLNAVLPNLVNTPDYKLQKAFNDNLYDSPRSFTISPETVAKANLETLKKNYLNMFKGSAGITVVVSGDFDKEEVLALVQKYIGSIKKAGKASDWSYRGDGIVDKNVDYQFAVKMEAPKVTVAKIYKNSLPYTVEAEVAYAALDHILDMVYVNTLREEEGGTYGASTMSMVTNEPNESRMMQIVFDTNVEQADKLSGIAKKAIEDIAASGADSDMYENTVKNLLKTIPEKKLRVAYWLSALETYQKYGVDYVNEYEAAVNALTPEKVQAAAKELVDSYLLELMMRPE